MALVCREKFVPRLTVDAAEPVEDVVCNGCREFPTVAALARYVR